MHGIICHLIIGDARANVLRMNQFYASLGKHISSSSAMNPGLLYTLIVSPLAMTGACSLYHFGHDGPAHFFAFLAALPILIVGWQLMWFTHKEADRLQRDVHIENKMQIQNHLLMKNGDTIEQYPISSELVPNPALKDKTGE